MPMKSILKNQTIRIDNHQRGSVPIKWDDPSQDIHLHKSQNGDKKRLRYEIKVPLNTASEVTFNGASEPIPSKIKKEIEEAFEDNDRKLQFISDLKNALENCNWNKNDAPKVAQKIAKVFGFTESELKNEKSPYCLRLINEPQIKYQVFINTKKKFLIVGEFQPFSANGLHKESKIRWNEYLFNNIDTILCCKSQGELKKMLTDAIREIPGIGMKTVDDTIARIQDLFEIFP